MTPARPSPHNWRRGEAMKARPAPAARSLDFLGQGPAQLPNFTQERPGPGRGGGAFPRLPDLIIFGRPGAGLQFPDLAQLGQKGGHVGEALFRVHRQAAEQQVLQRQGDLIQVRRQGLHPVGKRFVEGEGVGEAAGHQAEAQDAQGEDIAGGGGGVAIDHFRGVIGLELQGLHLAAVLAGEGEIGHPDLLALQEDIEGIEGLMDRTPLVGQGQGLADLLQQVQGLGQAEALLRSELGQEALAVERFLHQEQAVFGALQLKKSQDFRMAQPQSQDGLLAEISLGGGPFRRLPGQHLESHFGPQEQVPGQPHLAPGFFPEEAADLIAPARELGGGKIRPVVLHLGACLAFRGWAGESGQIQHNIKKPGKTALGCSFPQSAKTKQAQAQKILASRTRRRGRPDIFEKDREDW